MELTRLTIAPWCYYHGTPVRHENVELDGSSTVAASLPWQGLFPREGADSAFKFDTMDIDLSSFYCVGMVLYERENATHRGTDTYDAEYDLCQNDWEVYRRPTDLEQILAGYVLSDWAGTNWREHIVSDTDLTEETLRLVEPLVEVIVDQMDVTQLVAEYIANTLLDSSEAKLTLRKGIEAEKAERDTAPDAVGHSIKVTIPALVQWTNSDLDDNPLVPETEQDIFEMISSLYPKTSDLLQAARIMSDNTDYIGMEVIIEKKDYRS